MSTMTGFGGGWNAPAPGWEGPVLCSRPGPARAPAGTDSSGQDCSGGPELPGNPATSPSSRSSGGPPPRSPQTSRLAYRQPGPAPFVCPGSRASPHLQQATEAGAGSSALAAPTLRVRPVAAPQQPAMEAAMPARAGGDYNSQNPVRRDRGLPRPYGSCYETKEPFLLFVEFFVPRPNSFTRPGCFGERAYFSSSL